MHADPLISAFQRLLAGRPRRPLVLSPGRSATAGDVESMARAVECRLDAAGLAPGAPLGLQAPNGPGFLAGLLAALRRGHPPVLLDARARTAEVDGTLGRLGACGLLGCAQGWPARPEAFRLQRRDGGGKAGDAAARTRTPDDPAPCVIKLTSGSTGAPRGILTPTAALVADDRQLTASMGLREDDRLVAAVPMSHSYGLSSLVLPALSRGTTLVVPDIGDAFAPLAAARQAQATVFPTVPAYLAGLLRMSAPPALPASVRLVITAGARLLPETAAAFRRASGRAVHVFYGASECGGIAYDREGDAAERGEVGTPVEGVGVELRAVDGLPAADGGRVAVRSAATARGYLPEPDDRRLGSGTFLTDDLGCWRGPALALTGRMGDTINVHGRKVNPLEVEAVIAGLDGVGEVHVQGLPCEDTGDEIVQAVVVTSRESLTVEAIARWCRQRLSEHKVPRSIVLLDELPCTGRGKPDRHALRRLTGAAMVDGPRRG